MTRATARRPATSWRDWAWLPLAAAVILTEVAILVGLLSRDWTGVVVAGSLLLTLAGRVHRYAKTLRAKSLSR